MSTPDPQQQPSDPPPESPTVSFDKSATPSPAPPFEQPTAPAYDPVPGQAYDPQTGLPLGPPPVPPPYHPSPYGPPPGYGPQPYYGGYPGYGGYGPPPTNGMAIASLVLGITGFCWGGSILALVFGYIAQSQIRQRGETGGGMALAGIILGWIGVAFLVLYLLFVIVSVGTYRP